MSIINKPVVTRGALATFQLIKGDLAAHADVIASGYFVSQATWETVSLHYKSSTRDQQVSVKFDGLPATPEAEFFVSSYSQGDFLIDYLAINDHDGGKLIIPRANLVVADFDVIF